MRRTAQLRRCLQEAEVLTTPVAHDPLHAKGAERVGIEVAGFAGRIRFAADRTIGVFVSNFRKRREAHPLGTDASDEALIKAIARSDRHAMAVLYRRHHVRVYRFALRVTGDASLAEDIVSEVFFEVWRHADRFKSRAQVSTWLLAIARNKGAAAVKRRSGQQLDVETLEIEDPADDPDVLINKSDRSEAIPRCLSQLSAVQREVIDLVYYHEKSVGDVAKIVGVPASTVKTRMFYARRRMKEILRPPGTMVSDSAPGTQQERSKQQQAR